MKTWKNFAKIGIIAAIAFGPSPAIAGELCQETGGTDIAQAKVLPGDTDSGHDGSGAHAQPSTTSGGADSTESRHSGAHGGRGAGNWHGHRNSGGSPNGGTPDDS